MTQEALGLIEVIGLPVALEAADTCLKSSNIQLIGYEKVTSGLVTIKIQGDVGAVNAAIEAAKVSATKIGPVVSTLVIPRPATGIHGFIYSSEPLLAEDDSMEISVQKIDTPISNLKSGLAETTSVSPLEDVQSEDQEFEEPEEPEVMQDEHQNEEYLDQEYTCNLCHDPNCPREKGQPRRQCIHYQEIQK